MTPENEQKLAELRTQYGEVLGGQAPDGTLVAVKAPPRGAWKQCVDAISKSKGDTDGAQYALVCASLVSPALPDGNPDLSRMSAIVERSPGITQRLFDACSDLSKGGFDFAGN
ncbi:MAG: hypothetical protein R3B07_35735 [Polyangiaceae bacterium]